MPFARLLTLNAAVVIAADLTNRSLRVPSVARTSANSWSSQWESCWLGRWDTLPNSTNQTAERSVGSQVRSSAVWSRGLVEKVMLAVGAVVGVFGGSGVVGVVAKDSQAMIATVVIAASIMGVGKASIGLRKFFTMSPIDCNKGFFFEQTILSPPTIWTKGYFILPTTVPICRNSDATTTEHAGIRPEDWIDFPIGLNENSFTDPMPQPGVTYIYRVKALKANGIGGTTNPVEVSMP